MRRQVALRQGLVDGFSDTDSVITVFRGIPYANLPVGALRFVSCHDSVLDEFRGDGRSERFRIA